MGGPGNPGRLGPRVFCAACFSMISGYADVISFLRFNEFAGMQTGNMILMGQKIVTMPVVRVLFNIAVMGSNMGGVMGFSLLKDASPEFAARWAAPLVTALVVAEDVLDYALGSNKWHVCFLAASLGAMNFIGFSGKVGAMTALATGNLQKCAKGLYVKLSGKPLGKDLDATLVAGVVVLGTIVGSILGAAALKWQPFGHHWLLIPVAVTQFIALSFHDTVFADKKPLPELESPLITDTHTEDSKDDAPSIGGSSVVSGNIAL